MEAPVQSAPTTHPWVAEARNKIRFAVVGGPFLEWSEKLEFVQQMEAFGFDAFWANDHPLRTPDCWTTLGALAAATKKIRLLSLVSCIYYHSPALIARMAADVDRISNGRVVLGLGVGDDTQEFAQLNIPFPSLRDRQEALEEAIAIIRGLWGPTPFTYHGKHFQVTDANVVPRPVQQPYVPILIAGGGERVTLRQVAQFADMSNFGPHEWTGSAYALDDVRRKCDALRRHCEAQGRPYDAVLRSYYNPLLVLANTAAELDAKMSTVKPNPREHFIPFGGTPRQAIAHYQELIDSGIRYFLAVIRRDDIETARILAEQVMPELQLR